MTRTVKKQDRNDFMRRLERLDPQFAATPAKARDDRKPWETEKTGSLRSQSPILMTLLGFGLAFLALFAANDPEMVEALLIQGGWPVQLISYGTNGVSLLIIGLVIFYLANLVRIVTPRAKGRLNSGGLVIGAVAALAFTSLDPSHLQAGYHYVGIEDPGNILTFAQARGSQIANIDWGSVVMVSSSPK